MTSWRSCIALRSNTCVAFSLNWVLAAPVLAEAWIELSSPSMPSTQTQAPNVSQCNMLAAVAAARNFAQRGQFQPMHFHAGALDAAAGGYVASSRLLLWVVDGPGAGAGPGDGWNRR